MEEDTTVTTDVTEEVEVPAEETSSEAPKQSEEDSKVEDQTIGDESIEAKPEEEEKSEEKSEDKEDEPTEEVETPDESNDAVELDPKEKARLAYKERQESRKQIEQTIEEQYRTQTTEELVDTGLSEAEAKIEALRQQVELSNYRSGIIELNSNINQESLDVLNDFPVFNDKSPEYDKQFSEKVARLYQQAADLKFDESGKYVESAKITPYDFYKEMAELRGVSVTRGKIEGQKSANKMLSSVEPQSRASNQESTPEEEDLFLKGFNRGKDNPVI